MQNDWELCRVFLPVRTIEGKLAWGRLKRKKSGGVWKYRKLTADEFDDLLEIQAW